MKIPHKIKVFFGSLRGRLIISVALVNAILMSVFIVDLISRQHTMSLNHQSEEAEGLAQSLSTTSSVWIATNDIAGLQELVDSQLHHPDLIFAILTDKNGRILAHTDKSKNGQFLLDLPPVAHRTVISETPDLVDVAVPAILSGKLVGWVRVGLSQKTMIKQLSDITINGVVYAIIAILMGSFIAWLLGNRITRRLYAVQNTINEVGSGNPSARSHITGTDEAALLAQEFNEMLDALSEREEKISKSEARFEKLFNLASVPLALIDKEGVTVDYNKRFEQTFGYTIQDMPTINEWWQLAYPDPDYRKWAISTWESDSKLALEQNTDIESAEYEVSCKNGEVRTVVISGAIINDGLLVTFFDITERKRRFDELVKLNRVHALISQINDLILWSHDREKLFHEICTIATTYGKFRMSWIGLVDNDTHTVTPVAWDGFENGYFTKIKKISINKVAEGKGPTGTAIRKGKTFVCNDIANDPIMESWRNEAIQRGYNSSISIPIKVRNKAIGAFTLYSDEINFFSFGEVILLEKITNNIAFSLETILIEEERKQDEEKIRQLSQAVEQSPVTIFITDTMGTIQYVNPKFVETTGYSYEEAIGKNPRILNSGHTPTEEYKNLWKTISRGNQWHGNFYNKKKDGSLYWESSTISPIINAKGEITHYIAIKEDITERKQAEEKIRQLSQAVEQSPVTIVITNTMGTIQYVNPKFVETTGYSYEEAIGKNPRILNSGHTPPEEYKNLWRTISRGNEWHGEFHNKKKDGSFFWESSAISPIINAKGETTHYIAINEDITERKKTEEALRMSEKRMRTIIETEPECVKIIDQKGNLLDINASGLAMLESNSEEEVKSHNLLEFIVPEYRTAFRELHQRVMQGENGLLEFEIIGLRGTKRWLETHAAPMRDEKGEVTMLLGISRDVTNRKLAEEELIKAKESAEESDRLKSSFLANMSHEIRTPMNGILGFAELLKEPNLTDDEQKKYVKIIEKSGKRMLNIINDIIDISKIESKQMKVSISETNINEKIEYIFNFFKPEATKKGIQLAFKKGLTAKEALIKTDTEKIYAILTNLVKNAIKFTDKGTIEFGYALKENGKPAVLEFFVKDTGVGIPKDKQQSIFDRFIQADISDKRAFQGAGLGLSISKAYVEMLGGTIWVESEEGKDTTFYFTIPYNTEPKKDIIPEIASEKETENQIKDLKILIVEDDPISKLLISKAVSKFSKELLKASTGVEAVEACQKNPDIDLVMMDINMPIMDGYEATRKIRQFNKELIIIAQTANGLSEDREKAIAAGCTDYIAKPINIDLLKSLIQKYFDK
ncbi:MULTISPECIES: PAS domain S-box protein [unclassified Flavobacterium]|jgi:nitrogen fixation negative regulator NifL|uniref:PAS domain S-box protein n=1 Tax=unclassified Flavobacterium TaxID=196869 RepID=UPI0025B7D842|nr:MULTISPECIES: PAS domain S-box protein [unclassified Flavobacterium]